MNLPPAAPSKCSSCKKETAYTFRCAKCTGRFCNKCLRVDMFTKMDMCQACMPKTEHNIEVTGIDSSPNGFVVRWKFAESRAWGELSLFQKAEGWHIDTEGLSDDTIDAILLGIRKFATRAG